MVMGKPEVFIGQAQMKFDADGACLDQTTAKFVRQQMLAFSGRVDAVKRMRGQSER